MHDDLQKQIVIGHLKDPKRLKVSDQHKMYSLCLLNAKES